MSGYTPLFSSLTRGTLCGKWPDIGLWPVLLSMTDWRGEIDATPQYIAGVTGLALTEVIECIGRFCEPDLGSRCTEAAGARLVLIDPENRSWGWRVVNIQVYRDKASDLKQIADGRNAEKVRRYKERHKDTGGHCETPADTAGHPQLPPDTDSNSNSNSNSNKNQDMSGKPDRSPAKPLNGEAVHAVFSHWQTVWGHPQAKLDSKRKATITAALKLGYDTETLCQAISGYQNSAHHTGKNERSTVYDDIGLFLRDAEHIDAGLGHLKNPNKEKPKWV